MRRSKVTSIYIDFDREKADKAMSRVIDYLNEKAPAEARAARQIVEL